jgi:membrane fusion protein (multidrug efflux system)
MNRPLDITGSAALALLALCVSACNKSEANSEDRPTASATADPATARATRVDVAVIAPSEASLSLVLPGEVEAFRDAQLAAALGGYIESVTVKSGDLVKKGQTLALVDSATLGARRDQAQVELDSAEREWKRAEKLKGTLPGAQLDAAEARYLAAKAAYRTANVQASRSVIRAPFAGVIAEVDAEVGEVAPPGAQLIRLVQIDPAKVTMSLSDRDVLSVAEGMTASVSTDARATVLEGKVAHIHPAADTNTRSFIAEVEVPNADKQLLPGMIASIAIRSDVATKQVVIAQDWLVTRPDQLGVFVNEKGKAAWRTVKAGSVVGDRLVVREGLKAGDELVVAGHRELAAGDRLLVSRRGTCCKDGRVVYDGR